MKPFKIVAKKTRLYKPLTAGFNIIPASKSDGDCPHNAATVSFKRVHATQPPFKQWNLLIHVVFKQDSPDRERSTAYIKMESWYTSDLAWRWNVLSGAGTTSDYEALMPVLRKIESKIKRNLLELELEERV